MMQPTISSVFGDSLQRRPQLQATLGLGRRPSLHILSLSRLSAQLAQGERKQPGSSSKSIFLPLFLLKKAVRTLIMR